MAPAFVHSPAAASARRVTRGRTGSVTFRMLHVFEFEGDLIRSEQVWCDLAAIQAQLGVGTRDKVAA